MIPIVLDPKATPLALVGRGALACRRLEWLLAGGADALQVYSDEPSAELARAAGGRLRRRAARCRRARPPARALDRRSAAR